MSLIKAKELIQAIYVKKHRFVKKAMLCVWWNTRGVVHYEVLYAGNNVDITLYCQQQERVNRALTRQGIDPLTTRVLHDNARSHISIATQNKIE
jgi:histone-lysine N-methyltransferase SETMAR